MRLKQKQKRGLKPTQTRSCLQTHNTKKGAQTRTDSNTIFPKKATKTSARNQTPNEKRTWHLQINLSTTMLPLLILLSCVLTIMGFAPPTTHSTLTHHSSIHRYPPTVRNAEGGVTSRNSYHHRLTTTPLFMTSDVEQHDPNETVARRIIVTGDVNGGYYRTRVVNEVCITVI